MSELRDSYETEVGPNDLDLLESVVARSGIFSKPYGFDIDLLVQCILGDWTIKKHNERELILLASTLAAVGNSSTLYFGCVVCPDYGGYYINDIWHYKMAELGNGISQTAGNVDRFAKVLSPLSNRTKRPVNLSVIFPGWEVMERGELVCGLSITEARSRLESTADKTRDQLSKRGNDYFDSSVTIVDILDYRDTILSISGDVNPKIARSIVKQRQKLHGDGYKEQDAITELAEAAIAFGYLKDVLESHVIAIATTPVIALSLLNESPHIQLNHKYHG